MLKLHYSSKEVNAKTLVFCLCVCEISPYTRLNINLKYQHIKEWFFVGFKIKNNIKEWLLYVDIILLSAWLGYEGKTLHNGDKLGSSHLVISLLILYAIISFFILQEMILF